MASPDGGLVKARIVELDKGGKEKQPGLSVTCMFNPFEYTIAKSNTYKEKSKRDANTPHAEFFSAGAQTLKLNLIFDTYETGRDVREQTDILWNFMLTKSTKRGQDTRQGEKVEPPQVAFAWGPFWFTSFITSMTQKFTLFTHNGTPVRANVDVEFTQYVDVEDYPPQNPTSGGGPVYRVWQVICGDRLDAIAAEVYQDSTQWRRIADTNHITNPLALRPGQKLRIPLD